MVFWAIFPKYMTQSTPTSVKFIKTLIKFACIISITFCKVTDVNIYESLNAYISLSVRQILGARPVESWRHAKASTVNLQYKPIGN